MQIVELAVLSCINHLIKSGTLYTCLFNHPPVGVKSFMQNHVPVSELVLLTHILPRQLLSSPDMLKMNQLVALTSFIKDTVVSHTTVLLCVWIKTQ